MDRQNADLTQKGLGLAEHTELSEHRCAVVLDFFTDQTIIGIKRIHTAKRELNSPPRRRQATPGTQMRAANDDLNQNGVLRLVPVLHRDLQVGKSLHKLLIKQAHSAPARIVFIPRLIVVPRRIAKGAEHPFEVMLVLEANMLLNRCGPS
jgi:hypothetical protein